MPTTSPVMARRSRRIARLSPENTGLDAIRRTTPNEEPVSTGGTTTTVLATTSRSRDASTPVSPPRTAAEARFHRGRLPNAPNPTSTAIPPAATGRGSSLRALTGGGEPRGEPRSTGGNISTLPPRIQARVRNHPVSAVAVGPNPRHRLNGSSTPNGHFSINTNVTTAATAAVNRLRLPIHRRLPPEHRISPVVIDVDNDMELELRLVDGRNVRNDDFPSNNRYTNNSRRIARRNPNLMRNSGYNTSGSTTRAANNNNTNTTNIINPTNFTNNTDNTNNTTTNNSNNPTNTNNNAIDSNTATFAQIEQEIHETIDLILTAVRPEHANLVNDFMMRYSLTRPHDYLYGISILRLHLLSTAQNAFLLALTNQLRSSVHQYIVHCENPLSRSNNTNTSAESDDITPSASADLQMQLERGRRLMEHDRQQLQQRWRQVEWRQREMHRQMMRGRQHTLQRRREVREQPGSNNELFRPGNSGSTTRGTEAWPASGSVTDANVELRVGRRTQPQLETAALRPITNTAGSRRATPPVSRTIAKPSSRNRTVKKQKAEGDCPICLAPLLPSGTGTNSENQGSEEEIKNLRWLPCGHVFHRRCIEGKLIIISNCHSVFSHHMISVHTVRTNFFLVHLFLLSQIGFDGAARVPSIDKPFIARTNVQTAKRREDDARRGCKEEGNN